MVNSEQPWLMPFIYYENAVTEGLALRVCCYTYVSLRMLIYIWSPEKYLYLYLYILRKSLLLNLELAVLASLLQRFPASSSLLELQPN